MSVGRPSVSRVVIYLLLALNLFLTYLTCYQAHIVAQQRLLIRLLWRGGL